MPNSKTYKWLLLLAIMLLAAFFRLYKIDVLPPGETFDPAYYGLDALHVLDGNTPIFFEIGLFGGREPLYSYLVAACVVLFGANSLAIHIAPAIVGILTIPVVYLAAEELFSGEDELLSSYGGLISALVVALSFWHLSWSRYGVRAILTPLFAALVVFFLCRGLRTKRWRAFVFCGFFLGLGMYTYQAAWLLPVLVVVGFAYVVWRARVCNLRSVYALGTITLVSLLVFAPLGIYALQHPDHFMGRVSTVNVLESQQPFQGLTQQLKNTLLVFGFRGDTMPTTNLPGRSALNPFLFTAFVLGIVLAIWQIKKPVYFMLLAWLVIMCVPGVLAQYAETAKRIIGALPAVAMLIAVGLLTPLQQLQCWMSRHSLPKPASAALAVLWSVILVTGLVYSGVRTYTDYFVLWGEDPALFTHFEAGLAAIGQYAAQRPQEEQIYVSPVYVGHPSLLYNSQYHPGVKGYHGEYCIAVPDQSESKTTYIVVPGEENKSLAWLDAYLPKAQLVAEGPLHYQQPYFYAYEVPAGTQVQIAPEYPLHENWNNQIALLGYDLVPNQDDQTLLIRLYYKALADIETDYTVFIQRLGPVNPVNGSPVWSQIDHEPCRHYRPTSTWREDEILIDEFVLPASNIQPVAGKYELIMGFYQWQTMERLPVLDANERPAADYIILDWQVWDELGSGWHLGTMWYN